MGWAADYGSTPVVPGQESDDLIASSASYHLSDEAAQALERALADHPEDHVARVKLLGYYSQRTFNSKEAAEARRRHVLWLIEHEPAAEIAGSPYAGLHKDIDGQAFAKGKELWLAQAGKDPKNTTILDNAARYLQLQDSAAAEKLWLQAQTLEPANPKWPERLAQLYTLGLTGVQLPAAAEKYRDLAARALKANEAALSLPQSDEHRFYRLADVAKSALQAGDMKKAQAYASELLEKAKGYEDNWNYGNALHHGHLVLGRVALDAGDTGAAKSHLLEAGKTPGSPQLDSFGPNMSLARELLGKGERDAVIEYLQLCGRFWRTDRGRLQQWKAAIKNGKTPDFEANLAY